MKRIWGTFLVGAVLLLGVYVLLPAADQQSADERLTQYINLGKAFYENPTTQAEAVAEFKRALDLKPQSTKEKLNYALALLRAAKTKEGVELLQAVEKEDPKLPHPWFNLGIVYKKDGNLDEALQQLTQMTKLVPDEPITHYNLGAIHKLQGNSEQALKEFETARNLDPSLAAPHFQLYNLYRTTGRKEDADRELKIFQERKKAQEGGAIPAEDMEWSAYAEIYEPMPARTAPDEKAPAYKFEKQPLAAKADPGQAGLLVLDADGDGKPDLLVYSKLGIQLYLQGTTLVKESGLQTLRNVVQVQAGDFNNDGLADLAVLTDEAALLFSNAKGKFEKGPALPAGKFNATVWIDYDHDYDADLLLVGTKSMLLRNQGSAGFADHSDAFPFQQGEAIDAVAFRAVADTKTKDVLVSYKDHPAVLYQDRLTAKYEAAPLPAVPADATHLQAWDVDNNGSLDLVYTSQGQVSLVKNENGRFEAAVTLGAAGRAFVPADLANRSRADLVTGSTILRNLGLGKFAATEVPDLLAANAWASADFDLDGRNDLAAAGTDGTVFRLLNKTVTTNHWVRVSLLGVKNLKLAPMSEVEIKAGTSYQKRVYEGTPLTFGIGPYATIDTIRITWPNGLIQNEMRQASGKPYSYKEAQRLSGSCPLIFTWNGKEYEYITDVLGVAPLGAMSGDGKYFPTDHNEFIHLPSKALQARDGVFDIRMTEELSEVSYFDQLQLWAVDHPADIEIYTNEKWKGPPFPDFRLYGVKQRIYPTSARNQRGQDEREKLLHRDKAYADNFQHDYSGVAEMHSLTLDFGRQTARSNRAFLVLNGWVDWADGSTFLSQAQEGKGGLVTPYLQVKDARGEWKTVIDDMGMPSGKPKTIAVDLTGKFLSDSREVRIVTNLCVYWDEIFLGEDSTPPPVTFTKLSPSQAEVHFRGFSPSVIHPERKQPEVFRYPNPTTTSFWNPTPGLYTRYGDVTELVGEVDDRLVVMGSGDELQLRFSANRLPAMSTLQSRDFLLLVDGWAKDRDANTAYSQSVEPLPFHGMSQYPYNAPEAYPQDAFHAEYRRKYNTRPALRLLRPLIATR